MRKWEDIVKDKMEEFDETLPESVFVEFHAMRNGAAPDPAPKRFPLVWALVPAVAAGLAAVLLLRHPSTLDNGIQIIHQPVQPVAAVTDSVEVVETIQDQPLIAQASTPKVTRRPDSHPQKTEDIEMFEPEEETSNAGTQEEKKQTVPKTVQTSETKEEKTIDEPVVTTTSPFIPESVGSKPVIMKVAPAAGVIAGGGLLAAIATPLLSSGTFEDAAPTNQGEPPYGGIIMEPEPQKDEPTGSHTHCFPFKGGLSVGIPVAERLKVTTGLEYTLYQSSFTYTLSGEKKQFAHYLGIPVRLDWTLLPAWRWWHPAQYHKEHRTLRRTGTQLDNSIREPRAGNLAQRVSVYVLCSNRTANQPWPKIDKNYLIMKHFAIIGAMMAILMGSVSCEKIGGDNPKDNPYKRLELTTKSAEFARKGNDFAFNFIDRVNDATLVDFIISPLSMQFLLGMILDGAQGQTADEICSVLGYGAGEVDAVNEYCQAMLQQLPDMDKKTKLAIANAIVVNQKYQLLDSYKSTVGKYYDAEVANMDFDDNAGTTKKINKWCSDKTNGLVPEIIKNVNPYMFAYLMNAMYFKSEWKQKFPKGNTSSETFTAENGAKTSVQMMKIEKSFLYQDNDVMRVVRLPYGNGVYSMMVILPAEGKTIADVTSYLNGKEWDAFISNQVSCDVDLWLPKFETKFHIDLNDILSAMGMPSAFDAIKANFKAMSGSALCLSFVQQDAVIKVDEEGTEAAVVSSAGMLATSAGPGDHIVFHADHPFLYLITESSTGAVLFAGKYSGK